MSEPPAAPGRPGAGPGRAAVPTPRRGRSRLRAAQWPMVLVLTALWVLLWGTLSFANVATGVLVGVVVCVVFPLPPIDAQLRPRPVGLVRFAVRFGIDMVVASWRLNGYVLGPRRPRSAVLAVRMRIPSDLMLTATSVAVAAVPGSNVIDVHRASGTLYIHVLGAADEEALERARYEVLRLEDRLVRAFGTRADLAALKAWDDQVRSTESMRGGSGRRRT